MWKRLIKALATAFLLSGCQTLPTLVPPAAPASPSASHQLQDETPGRHLLETNGSNDACIWAMQYEQSQVTVMTGISLYQSSPPAWIQTYKNQVALPAGALLLENYAEEFNSSQVRQFATYLTGNADFVGKGSLKKASYNRYIYQVPDNQMLVINHLAGSGAISMDGYSVDASRGDVHYVFGAGEIVVFSFSPTRHFVNTTVNSEGHYSGYDGLTIEGFTVSPNVLGGVSSMLASEAK
ncbi:MAG TPA: hypothetical protein V6D47_02540 [Oscillatoriaceae cyanobacterium]